MTYLSKIVYETELEHIIKLHIFVFQEILKWENNFKFDSNYDIDEIDLTLFYVKMSFFISDFPKLQ